MQDETLTETLSLIDEETPLPEGWRLEILENLIGAAQAGFAIGERDSNGAVQLRMNNVTTQGTFDWTAFIRVPTNEETLEFYKLRAGDVLFNNTNSTELVGKTVLFNDYLEPVTFSNHFTRIRTKQDELEPGYLAHWLISQFNQKVFADICDKWIGQSAVQKKKLFALKIPLPPTIEEQRRIASVLDEQMKAVEGARLAVEEQLKAANLLPNAFLRVVFESEEAQNWQKRKLGEVCSRISNGTSTTQNLEKKGLPVSRIETISFCNINTERVGYIDRPKDELERYILNRGDILFSHINSLEKLGNCAIYNGTPETFIHGMNLLRFEIDKEIADSDFVLALLRTEKSKKFYESNARRAIGQASLNTKDLGAMKVLLPEAVEEQRKIAEKLKEQMQAAETLKKSLTEKLEAIKKLPAALLRKAFAGEI